MTNNHVLKTFGVVLTGAAVGAAAGLLFAPASGSRTRKNLRRSANRMYDRLHEMRGETIFCARDGVGRMKDSIGRCIVATRRGIDAGCSAAVRALENVQIRIDREVEKLSQVDRPAG
jgi:gas vesicle protein